MQNCRSLLSLHLDITESEVKKCLFFSKSGNHKIYCHKEFADFSLYLPKLVSQKLIFLSLCLEMFHSKGQDFEKGRAALSEILS